jgi:hypothetical protein
MKRALPTMAVVSTLAMTMLAGASVAQTLPSAVGTLQTWNETTRTAPRRASAQPRRTLQLLPWSDTNDDTANAATDAAHAASTVALTQRADSNEPLSASERSAAQRDASGAWLLPAMRVSREQLRQTVANEAHAIMHAENDEQPIVIEMFEAPNVTPFAAPFVLHPFGPPRRPLRLISSFDDENGSPPRVTVTVTPALTILRDYDGATMQQPEVRIDVVAIPNTNALIFLPMRVLSMTDP